MLSRVPFSIAVFTSRSAMASDSPPSLHHAQQRGIVHRAVEAVGAEHHGIAGGERVLGHVDVRRVARAEHVGEHVAHRVVRERAGSRSPCSASIVAAHVSSWVTCTSAPPLRRYSRLSPTLPTIRRSRATSAATTVVPMPV